MQEDSRNRLRTLAALWNELAEGRSPSFFSAFFEDLESLNLASENDPAEFVLSRLHLLELKVTRTLWHQYPDKVLGAAAVRLNRKGMVWSLPEMLRPQG